MPLTGLECWNCGHHYDEYNFTRYPDCGAFASDNPAFDLTEEEEYNDTNDYDDIDDPRDDEDSFEDEHEEIDDDDTF